MENIIHLHYQDNSVLEVYNSNQAKDFIACDPKVVDVLTDNYDLSVSLTNYLKEVK